MTPVHAAPELWAGSMLPEGFIEDWLVPDGALVETGDALAVLRVEDARHKVMAPAKGRLTIDRRRNAVVEPGAVIAHIGRC